MDSLKRRLVAQTLVEMIESPPESGVRDVGKKTCCIASIISLNSVALENFTRNFNRDFRFLGSRCEVYAERVDLLTMCIHTQHHYMLWNDVERDDDSLTDKTRSTASNNGFKSVAAASLCKNVPNPFVSADVEHAGNDLKWWDPEATVQPTNSFRLVNLASTVNHAFVDVVLELNLELRFDDCQRVKSTANGERWEHRQREEFLWSHEESGSESRRTSSFISFVVELPLATAAWLEKVLRKKLIYKPVCSSFPIRWSSKTL